MKSIVVEIRGQFAAVLCDDGCIVKVKNDNYVIGQEIKMKNIRTKKQRKLAWIACAACAAVITCASGGYAYATPSTYVSLDVNPALEFSLNRFDRVISVKAVNEDADSLLKEIKVDNLGNKHIDDALAITMEQLTKDGYFDGDKDSGVIISTSAKDLKKAAKLAAKLEESVKEDLAEDDSKDNDSVAVEAISVGKERVEKARALGVTPGKLNLVEKLKASAPNSDIKLEDWLDKPVKEIMKETNKNKEILRNEQKADQEKIDDSDNNKVKDKTNKPVTSNTTTESAVEKNKGKDDKIVNQELNHDSVKDEDNKATNANVKEDKAVESETKDTMKEEKDQNKTDKESNSNVGKGSKSSTKNEE